MAACSVYIPGGIWNDLGEISPSHPDQVDVALGFPAIHISRINDEALAGHVLVAEYFTPGFELLGVNLTFGELITWAPLRLSYKHVSFGTIDLIGQSGPAGTAMWREGCGWRRRSGSAW